jgi:Ca2+-binding EF-hand superfamily protein
MRNRDRSLPVFLLSLALTVPAAVDAQDKAKSAPAKPGQSGPAEQKQPTPYEERFQQLDRDKDNYVSPAEWPLDRAKFDLVDRNKDGRLSRSELLTPNVVRDNDELNERLRQADTDRDGILSPAERQRAAAAANAAADRARRQENTWNPRATSQDQRSFQSLDRDRNNRLDRRELRNAGGRFERLDRNRDGTVSPNEWPRQ